MSQWVEVRHLHLVEGVPKKEIARRLKLDVKTVRRAIGRPTPPVRVSPPRPSTLTPWREQIKQWLCAEPRLTAKRIRRLLLPLAGPLPARTVRRYVAGLRAAGTAKEAFVHRSVLPGTTMEVDFGESWVDVAGVPCKVKYLVATLPFSNAYFAKAYPARPLRRRDPRRAGLRAVRQGGRRPAVRLHQPALRAPEPRRDDESAVRALVRGVPRRHGRRRGHRPDRPPRHRVDDCRRQLPAQDRHTQPGVPRATGGATAIALIATWPPVAPLRPATSR